MNQTNKYPPYAIIDKAVNGDESAITLLLKYYEAYISKLCLWPNKGAQKTGNLILQGTKILVFINEIGILTGVIKKFLILLWKLNIVEWKTVDF